MWSDYIDDPWYFAQASDVAPSASTSSAQIDNLKMRRFFRMSLEEVNAAVFECVILVEVNGVGARDVTE